MADDTLKTMTRARKLAVGHFIVEFATPGIGHLMKNAGAHFVLFDMEHSGFTFETVKSAVRYMEAAHLPMITRVPSRGYDHIARVLDMGAEGVMVPMVNDGEEAAAVVAAAKYTPDGARGVALGIAHDGYSGGDVLPKLAAANARTTLFAQIETAAGVDNVEAIAATPGIDCLWVGHFDLSASLGIPGEFTHKDFTGAVEKTIEAAHKHGKAAGRLVPSVESAIEMHAIGFDMICYAGDVWMFQAALGEAVTRIRAEAKPPAAAKPKPKPRRTRRTTAARTTRAR